MSSQEECLKLERALKEYLFVPHRSVAVRMITQDELDSAPVWLEKFRRPGNGAPEQMITCQVMAMVRTYGWKILLTPEVVNCPTSLLTLGWAKMSPEYEAGEWPVTPYNQSKEARSRRMKVVPMLPLDKYVAMAAAPLTKCPFDPDVVVIYGTPAQVMRMVQGALFKEGGVLESAAAGGTSSGPNPGPATTSGPPRRSTYRSVGLPGSARTRGNPRRRPRAVLPWRGGR